MVTMATCLGALIVLVLMTSVSSSPIATGEDGTLKPPIVVQYLTPPEGQGEQLTSGDVLENLHRNAVMDKSRRWANGIVPYTISKDFPSAIQLTIREAMNEIEADAANGSTKCVQFVPRTTEPRFLQVNTGSGCHSTIGYDETEELSSTLGAGCEQKGIIMHELLHVLGFYHEQNRPDRDLYVDINETNVALIRDFYIRNSSIIDVQGAPYDFGSIMHYPAFAFPIEPTYPTITPKPRFAAGLRMGQRIALSKIDVIKLQRLYGCVEDAGHVFSDLDHYVLSFCDFGQGMCDFSYPNTTAGLAQPSNYSVQSTDDLAQWTVTSASISGGPKGGMTNGLDSFLYASRTAAGELAQDTTPLTTTSVLTPVMRSPDDGKLCITFQMYQRGPVSFISMYLVFETIPRTLLMVRGGNANRWSRAVLTTELPPGLDFQLEIVANLAQEPLAIDDFYVLKSKWLPYDFGSIMHYGAYSMAKIKAYPVTTPKPQLAKGLRLGQRYGLSQLDVLKLQRLYQCVEDTSHVLSDLDLHLMTSCDFSEGMCQLTTGPGPIQWKISTGPVEGGPNAGFTNGLDEFLYVAGPNTSLPMTSSVLSPVLYVPPSGRVCVSMEIYQKGPTSFLSIYLLTPAVPRVKVDSYPTTHMDNWARAAVDIVLEPGAEFQMELEATLLLGSVSVDDVFVFRDRCVYMT